MRRALVLFLASFSGCAVQIPEGRIACVTEADCPSGWYCIADRCYSSPRDIDGGADGGSDAGSDAASDAGACTSAADCDDALDCTDDACTDGVCANTPHPDACVIDGACVAAGAVELAVSSRQTCSVRTDGTLWCWGQNSSGQLGVGDTVYREEPARVGTESDWTQVANGDFQTCAIRAGGELYCWGDADSDVLEPVRLGAESDWTVIAMAGQSACGLRAGGELYCWGANRAGQLGLGDTMPRDTPTRVGTRSDWEHLELGAEKTCAIPSDGSLWCWGNNNFGALGLGAAFMTMVTVPTPNRVGTATGWVEVSSGSFHTCARRDDGTVWCWGLNTDDRLGVATAAPDNLHDPMPVGVSSEWTSVSVGFGFTCGIRTDRSLWCWGSSTSGILGENLLLTQPTRVGTSSSWAEVEAGFEHACGRQDDGSVWCWGTGVYGELGLGEDGVEFSEPQRLAPCGHPPEPACGAHATQITTGLGQTCALRDDGTIWCWGSNSVGELGVGDMVDRLTATQVGIDSTWTQIEGGQGPGRRGHVCALQNDGSLWCWGLNASGQLGLADALDRDVPTRVGTGTMWTQVSAGLNVTCAIQSDTSVWCWGDNAYGMLGSGDTVDRDVPTSVGTGWADVSVGASHVCGVRTDGSLWCWGGNIWGQLGVDDQVARLAPAQVGTATSWVQVSAGEGRSCAVSLDGSLFCWGMSDVGGMFLDVPTLFTASASWTEASAGLGLSGGLNALDACALRTDGSLWCWAPLADGVMGVDDRESARLLWDDVSVSRDHTCAIQRDGSVWCWGGLNTLGWLGVGDAMYRPEPWRVGCL